MQCCINIAIINAEPAKLGLRAKEMLNMKLQRENLFQVMLHYNQVVAYFRWREKPLRFRSRSMTCLLQPQLSPDQDQDYLRAGLANLTTFLCQAYRQVPLCFSSSFVYPLPPFFCWNSGIEAKLVEVSLDEGCTNNASSREISSESI